MSDETKQPFECAASGKSSDDLEASVVCKMAKSCQKNRHSSHDEECKSLGYEQLSNQDCLICFFAYALGVQRMAMASMLRETMLYGLYPRNSHSK